MSITRIMLSLVVVLAIAGGVAAFPLTSGNDSENIDPASRDAQEYADHIGISLEEAQNRLALQKLAGELDAKLTNHEGQTFGGLWIEHTPEFKVVVQLTQDPQEAVDRHNDSDDLAAVLDTRTVDVSLAQLQEVQSQAIQAIDSKAIPIESGIDVQGGKVKVYVAERDRLDEEIEEGRVTLPDRVDLVTVSAMGQKEADIYGGLALSKCTSGFSVKNSSGTKGITTAGHCDNNISYNGTDLPFKLEKEDTVYDIQWHTAPGFTVTNKIRTASSGSTRSITGTVGRNSQALNSHVCKYGKITHYTCGYIKDKNYRPSGHSATFILVDNTAGYNDLSSGGDSGGPWFHFNDAYGTHFGAPADDPNDAVYMAVNFILPGIHVNVMTSSN